MKLGNYKWKFCNKCGKKYVVVNGKIDKHKCDKETLIAKVKRFFNCL